MQYEEHKDSELSSLKPFVSFVCFVVIYVRLSVEATLER